MEGDEEKKNEEEDEDDLFDTLRPKEVVPEEKNNIRIRTPQVDVFAFSENSTNQDT